MRWIIQIVLCLVLVVLGVAPDAVYAAVSINLQMQASNNLQVFFLKDLNVSGSSPAAVVFYATVQTDSPVEGYLTFSMSTPQILVMEGKSNPFLITAGIHQYSNLNLTDQNNPCYLTDYQVSQPDADEIQNKLLETGYFPTDNYRLRLALYSASNTDSLMAADEVSIYLTNPFDITLLSPNGTPGSPAFINNTTPLFSWSSPANRFLIKICEKTSENMDPESVMNGRPNHETDPLNPLTTQSFVYPASGEKPLETGLTYFWQIKSIVETSSGLQEYPSPIAAFTIMTQMNPQVQMILESLQRILGGDLESTLTLFEGYQPNGLVRLDGMVISIGELQSISEKFSTHEYTPRSITTK